MSGADLEGVMALLQSERMDEQFRLLRAGNLLTVLRSAVLVLHSRGAVSKGANRTSMSSIQSKLVAPLHELLVAVLRMKIRAEKWHQAPAVLLRGRFLRSAAVRDLRQFALQFRALASHVQQVHLNFATHHRPSSYSTGVHGPVDALRAPMMGRSELLEKMVRIVLAGASAGALLVMPIVGGAGTGKTRLAMALLNDGRVRRKFGVRVAVPVVRNRHYRLDRALLRTVDPERVAYVPESPEDVAFLIELKLSRGDYLIVLDDVWSDGLGECPEIGALMKVLPPNGRLVVTARTPDVASYLATLAESANNCKLFHLRPLGQEFSSAFVADWIATYRGDWPAELIGEAGTMIANRCGGVPVLLDYARTHFCQPQGMEFWRRLLEHDGTNVHPDMFWGELLACIAGLAPETFWNRFLGHSGELPDGNEILESAAVSYQNLPSDMRSCLLYCSMFPLSYGFKIEELADLLAAEGYIPAVVTEAQRRGFLQQLLDECFYPLQAHEYGGECKYRMHKVLHIFAHYMGRITSSVIRVDQAAQSSILIRRASLIVHPLTTSIPATMFDCQDLGALILLQEGSVCPPDQPRCEITEITQEFFESFSLLRALSFRATKIRVLPTKFLEPSHVKYLNLSQTDIDNIPSSISRLMFLQVLILSHCDKLRKLHPNTTKLARLRKLDLEGCCSLAELPRDMCKMKSLEHLNVTECSSLTQLPCGMGQLESLQTLLGYNVSGNNGSSISELQSMENLYRLSLQGLEKVSDILDVRYACLEYKTNLESLSLRWSMDDYSNNTIPAYAVLESLQPHRLLKSLEIVAYEGMRLPSWITAPYLKSLVEIKLINLRSCEEVLPPLGLLPCLKIAEISGAENICSINDRSSDHKGTFRSLEKLTFSYMHNLEVWEQTHRAGMFPRLTELVIIQCPKLRALHMELPSVEKLTLWMNNNALYGLKGSLQGVAKNLEHISISFSEELLSSSNCEGLQDLGKLTKLELCGCDELTCLPQGLKHLFSIRSLTIDNCSRLETLPDWLESLPSLQILRLSCCPVLHYIPVGLQRHPGVIIYVEDCPSLQEPIPNFPAQSSGKPVAARVNKGKEVIAEEDD
ncbi:hypothetical protein ACP70R_008015 [Stipagrostis hirtigluma subsp. patula]